MNIFEAFINGAAAMRTQPPNSYQVYGSLLTVAAGMGDAARLRVLCEHGAQSDWKELNNALATAAEEGHVVALDVLLNQKPSNKTEALFAAARRGQVAVVEHYHTVLEHSLKGVWYWAVIGGHVELARYLQKVGDAAVPPDMPSPVATGNTLKIYLQGQRFLLLNPE